MHRNAQGYLVPESLIKPIDLLRDDVVRKQVVAALALQLQMAAAKVPDAAGARRLSGPQRPGIRRHLAAPKGNITPDQL